MIVLFIIGNIQELAICVAILDIKIPRRYLQASLLAQRVRICSAYQCRQPRFGTWVERSPEKWLSTQVCLPGGFYGQRSLLDCSPWGHKKLDMTEWLTLFIWGIYLKLTQDCKSTILQYIFFKYQEKLPVIYNIFITCLLIHI